MNRLSPIATYNLMEGMRALCYGMIFTASALYQVNVVGLSPLQLVLVGTVLEAVYFVFQIPTGVVADVYSRRLSVIIGFVGTGLAFTVEGLWPSFAGVLTAMVIWGIAVTFVDGALEAWISDEVGPERAEQTFFRSGQQQAVLGIAGIVLATLLARAFGEALPIVLGGALISLTGLLMIVLMPEQHFTRNATRGNPLQDMLSTARAGIAQMRGNRVLLLLTLVAFVNGLWSEGFDRLWTKHLLDTHGLGSTPITLLGWQLREIELYGALNVLTAVLGITLVEAIRRRLQFNDNMRMVRAVLALTLVMAAGVGVFALAPTLAVALAGYLIASTVRGPLGTARLAWVNRQIAARDSGTRATVLSMWSQADALGQVTGGPAVGALGNSALRLALATAALLILVKTPLYGTITTKERNH
jgi:MFS transporter, DHA3 family, tetracycline resistance protein